MRLRLWQLILLVLVVCVSVVGYLEYHRRTLNMSAGALLARLPKKDAVQLVIDVRTLRQTGLLDMIAGSKAVEDSEYRSFVQATGFDYRRNLDLVCASFVGPRSYFLLRGQFDWRRLNRYAVDHKGTCNNNFCSVPMDKPNTYASFYPLAQNVLAIGFGPGMQAFTINSQHWNLPPEPTRPEPIWFTFPSQILSNGARLPLGTQLFASAMNGTEQVTLALGAGDGGRFQLTMQGSCPAPEKATAIAGRLNDLTTFVRKSFEREKEVPNPAGMSGILTSGKFEARGMTVEGRWSIERAFLETLAEGNP